MNDGGKSIEEACSLLFAFLRNRQGAVAGMELVNEVAKGRDHAFTTLRIHCTQDTG
jgi:hypothetical protein